MAAPDPKFDFDKWVEDVSASPAVEKQLPAYVASIIGGGGGAAGPARPEAANVGTPVMIRVIIGVFSLDFGGSSSDL